MVDEPADRRERPPSRDRGPSNGHRRSQHRRRGEEITAGGSLPRWVREEIGRVTPKSRRDTALEQLQKGADAYAAGRFGAAYKALERAKQASSRSSTIRELLGLSAYHTSRWQSALQELRTYRRLTGDTAHMPVEMDCLRALDRGDDVLKTWETFQSLGGSAATDAEARVVLGSFLLDEDDARQAWEVTHPKRVSKDPPPWELRRWYVAARAAARLGDQKTARQLRAAIHAADSDFVGLQELDRQIG